jgi:hypothetical protein
MSILLASVLAALLGSKAISLLIAILDPLPWMIDDRSAWSPLPAAVTSLLGPLMDGRQPFWCSLPSTRALDASAATSADLCVHFPFLEFFLAPARFSFICFLLIPVVRVFLCTCNVLLIFSFLLIPVLRVFLCTRKVVLLFFLDPACLIFPCWCLRHQVLLSFLALLWLLLHGDFLASLSLLLS